MTRYKHLLFDADETLFDFKAGEKCAFREALDKLSLTYSDESYALYHDINDGLWKALERGEITRDRLKIKRFEDYFAAVGVDAALAESMAVNYMEALSHQRIPMSEAEDTVHYLSHKYDIYVITNGITFIQNGRMNGSVFEKYVKHMFISEDLGAAKPSKEYFDKVIAYIGDSDRDAYLVIGDSLTADIDGGNAAGVDTCLFDPDGKGCGGRNVTYCISHLSELTQILS